MSAFDGYVQAAFHGGTMKSGPCFTVVHDAETPLRAGYTDSIVEMFRVGPKAGTSAHAMVDPVKAIKMLPDNVVAYAAGPKANPLGWHLEQAGYASFTRAQWTTPDGMAQLRRAGACLREVHDTWGIPKRWMTDDQLRRAAAGDRSAGGMTTHKQVTRVLGGTTHTDPEENYPRDLLLEAVLNDQGDDMANSDEILAYVKSIDARVRGTDPNVDSFTLIGLKVDAVQGLLIGGNTQGRNNFHWLAEQITAAVASIPGAKVDQETLRAAIAESVTFTEESIAKAAADEADRRARDGDPATGPVS